MTVTAPEIVQFDMRDFSGGLNLRDAEALMSPRETPSCMNVTFDDRGGVVTRLGYEKDADMSALPANVTALHDSSVLGQLVVQCGTRLFRRTAPGSYSEIQRAGPANAFGTSQRAGFADFRTLADGPALIVVHPNDGVLKYTGSGNLTPVTSTVKGNSAAVWQNKVWVVGDGTARVWWSNAGDAGTWTTATDFNHIRDFNDEPCTLVAGVPSIGGGDAAGSWRALIVAKARSVHRITDSSTGEYVTIGSTDGAGGPGCAAAYNGWLYLLSRNGVVRTDGLSPPVLMSARIEPLFSASELNLASESAWAAGVYENRLLFSLGRSGSSSNNLTLEFKPPASPDEESSGWWAIHSFGASAFATFDGLLYHGHPAGGLVYRTFTGGTDDGTAISAHWRTPALMPLGGTECRIRRVLLLGRGRKNEVFMWVKRNRDMSDGTNFAIDLDTTAEATWGGGDTWGGGKKWSASGPMKYDEVWELGVCSDLSLLFRITTSSAINLPRFFEAGTVRQAGSFGLYSIRADVIPLGV